MLGAGAGDNAAAALGLAAGPGDVVVSIGTSGVVTAIATQSARDATGTIAGFADATGRFLPLVCTLNAARVLDATARLLGVDHAQLSALALAVRAGSHGLVLVPYLEGERTPNLPDATGSLHGLTLANSTPAHLARAAVEGMLCGLADGLDALVASGVDTASRPARRWGRRVGSRPADRTDGARPSGRGPRTGGVRRGRRLPPGGVGAVGRGGATDLDHRHERVLRRPGATRGAGAVRRGERAGRGRAPS